MPVFNPNNPEPSHKGSQAWKCWLKLRHFQKHANALRNTQLWNEKLIIALFLLQNPGNCQHWELVLVPLRQNSWRSMASWLTWCLTCVVCRRNWWTLQGLWTIAIFRTLSQCVAIWFRGCIQTWLLFRKLIWIWRIWKTYHIDHFPRGTIVFHRCYYHLLSTLICKRFARGYTFRGPCHSFVFVQVWPAPATL